MKAIPGYGLLAGLLALTLAGCLSPQAPDSNLSPAPKESIRALIRTLGTGTTRELMAAAEQLAKIGPAARPAVPALVQLVQPKNQDLCIAAVGALSAIKPPLDQAMPVFLRAMREEYNQDRDYHWENPGPGFWAQNALLNEYPPEDVAPRLIPYLMDPDWGISWSVYNTLLAMGPAAKDAAPALVKLLQRKVEDARRRRKPTNEQEALQMLAEEDMQPVFYEVESLLCRIGEAGFPAVRKCLHSEDASVREAAMRIHNEVVRLGPEEDRNRQERVSAILPGYMMALRDPEPGIVKMAFRGIKEGNLFSKELLPILLELLDSPTAMIRANAAECIGELRTDARSAEPALCRAIKDPDDTTRHYAALSLGKLRSPSATRFLLQNLDDGVVVETERDDPALQSGIVEGLACSADPRVVEPLLVMMWDKSETVGKMAAQQLGWLGDRRAIRNLVMQYGYAAPFSCEFGDSVSSSLRYLCDRADAAWLLRLLRRRMDTFKYELPLLTWDPTMRGSEKLSEIAGICEVNPPRELHSIFLGPERIVDHGWASNVLHSVDVPSIPEPLKVVTGGPSMACRVAAAFCLLEKDPDEAGEPLVHELIRDYHCKYYRWVQKTLGELIRSGRAEEALATALRSDDWFLRLMAAEALMPVRRKEALDVLLPALKDRDTWCRVHALRALDRTLGTDELDVFVSALKDRHWLVRTYAVSALGDRIQPRSIQAIADALGDSDDYVRWYASMALYATDASAATDQLRAAMKEPNDYILKGIQLALIRADGSNGFKTFNEAVQSTDRLTRANAIRQLSWDIPADQVARRLQDALKDPDAFVRLVAIRRLWGIGRQDLAESLAGLLNDPDKSVSRETTRALDWFRKAGKQQE